MARTKQKARGVAWGILLTLTLALVTLVIVGFVMLFRLFSPLLSGGAHGTAISVENVVGKSEEVAIGTLRTQGLVPKVLHRVLSDEQDSGNVFKQNPSAGQKVKRGRTVLLWVSLGRASFIVPDLTGEHIDNVQEKLVAAGLTLGTVTKVYYEGKPAGRVLNQNPIPGYESQATVPVDVWVADKSNLPHNPMPDVTDMQLSAVEDVLARANLHLAKVTYVANDTEQAGTVLKQNVPANTDTPLGKRIELEVAMPSAELTAANKTITVRIPVPSGPAKQKVRIKVYDALNTKGQVAYEKDQAPGEVVEQKLDLEGKATVQIFIDNMDKPYREDQL